MAQQGLQALIDPLCKQTIYLSTLKEIVSALNNEGKQTVIMELYHHEEELYEVMQFVLTAKIYWPKVTFVIFTDVINHSILALLASHSNLSLVSKLDELEHLLAAISAARYAINYRSPVMRQLLQQQVQPLSRGEWHILRLMISGADVRHIASATHRSYKTVCSHKLNIMRKLGVNSVGFMLLVLVFRTRFGGNSL
ncbi:LuxR C-terminal-related transcriptional regulator [Serratia sp. L9]|uniref:LuxR C-terminal-related transcriptional regulator n=1 Tax=Serratia sp. L9 TaxID=3423946 RepID=UPI003D669059